MKNEWLSELIFDTNLIDDIFLSEKEKYCIVAISKNGHTYKQVGNKIGITDERVRQICEKAISKTQHLIREIAAKAKRHDTLLSEKEKVDQELSILKKKFKKQLAAQGQIRIDFHIATLSIEGQGFDRLSRNG